MSMQLQLSSTVTGWEMWVFLRINHFHNQERIFSIGTTFCQFSLCNMVKHERNVRSLITPIYLPAKLLLLRPSGNVQDFLRYVRLPQDSLLSSISFFAIKNKTHWSKTPGQKKKKKLNSADMGEKWEHLSLSSLALQFRVGSLITNSGWKCSWSVQAVRKPTGVCKVVEAWLHSLAVLMLNIIFSHDKFMQSESISNIAGFNAIQTPRCSTNIMGRVQIYLGKS